MSFLYQSITPVSSPPFSPPVMALILLKAALPYWLSGQTQRSPSPRALLQSEHIEPLCSHVLHPPYTAHSHKHTHGLHLSPQLREKPNETVIHLPISAPVLTSSDCRSQKCATKILRSKYHWSESPLNCDNYLIIYYKIILLLLRCCLSNILVLLADAELLLTILYVVG